MELQSVKPEAVARSVPLFWLSKTNQAEVTLEEGDIGALMIVSVIDKSGKKRVEGMLIIPREKLVELRGWVALVLNEKEVGG